MTRRPLVHIGMPKCASTWLQKRFFTPEHGFQVALPTLYTYTLFINPRSFQFQDPRESMELDCANGQVPVLTAEALVGSPLAGGANGETNLYRLQQSLPEARILLVIREQQAMLRSLYKLLVNWGSPYPIETLLYNDLAGNVPRFDPSFLYYDHIINAYQQAFGAESVLVLTLEDFESNPHEFLNSITSFCEIDTDQYPIQADSARRENEGRSLLSLEYKRLYNRYVAKTKFSMGGLLKPIRIQGKANINPNVPAFIDRWMEDRFTKRIQRMTEDIFAESNARTKLLTGLPLDELGYRMPEGHSP